MPQRLFLHNFGPVHALPVLHYRLEFADLVREAVTRLKPDCIALELPPALETTFLRGVARLPQVSIVACGGAAGDGERPPRYLLIEPADPLVEAARLGLAENIPVRLIDVDLDDYPLHADPLPDSYTVHRLGLTPYYREFLAAYENRPVAAPDLFRERGMAWRLQQLGERYGRILFVCGMYHLERIAAFFSAPQAEPLSRLEREQARLYHLHPDSCREVMGEYPFMTAVYERRRQPLPKAPATGNLSLRKRFNAFELIAGRKEDPSETAVLEASILRAARLAGPEGEMTDRQRVLFHLFQEAARHYRQETGDSVHHWQRRAFFRFSRNYAMVSGALLPDLYQLLAAARGCVDDNFAYALWRLATFLPWQAATAEIPTITLSAEDIWGGSRSIRFRPRTPGREKGLTHLRFLRRNREKRPGEWLEGFDDPAICSYPPEDLVVESYGHFLQKKGVRQLAEEEVRVEPFTVSLLDGVDVRATLRNIHEGRLYVREEKRIAGGVGAVVVIFSEDSGGKNFPYRVTWLGEHEQESDMAFYATSPADNIVGPGICRCEYGGFLLSSPPRRLRDVWGDPDYAYARTNAEVLLLAALDYSTEKHVVYAAPRPARSYLKQLAGRLGKRIIYLPLGSLSPISLKKLRVMHILHGHDKRGIAKDYIW